jgi:hypothetical protein
MTVPASESSGSSKPQLGAIELLADASLSSPVLSFGAASGEALENDEISLWGGDLVVGLEDVRILSVSSDSVQAGVALEQVSIVASKFEWIWDDGSGAVAIEWDAMSNTGGSSAPFNQEFVFLGQGVSAGAFPTAIPFTRLSSGISKITRRGLSDEAA